MIPRILAPETKSPGEKALFRKLEADPNCESWIVLHSLDIAEHVNQQQGEADFVVIVPNLGVLCLEVKAHREICVEEGTWYFGRHRQIGKSPFKQASEAMYSLKTVLHNKNPHLAHIPFFYGVVFTNASFNITSSEWHSAQFISYQQFISDSIGSLITRLLKKNLEILLTKKQNWYDPKKHSPNKSECDELVSVLRPSFEIFETPKERVKRLDLQIKQFTKEQFSALDAMEDNHRVIFAGPAGTGKTVLAIELARREVIKKRRVLFLCFNQLLGHHLKQECQPLNELVTTTTFHAYIKSISGIRIPEQVSKDFWQEELPDLALDILLSKQDEKHLFDTIIIDEAQDLLHPAYLDILDLSLVGGLNAGRWYLFGDFSRQAIYKDVGVAPETFLKSRNILASTYKLAINCRNTHKISEYVEIITRMKPKYKEVLRKDEDYQPKIVPYKNIDEQLSLLLNELEVAYEAGFKAEDIVILTCCNPQDSVLKQIDGPWSQRIAPFDRRVSGLIGYGTIHSFKGLESSMIIITDVNKIETREEISLLYVGCTRALLNLVLFVSENAREQILNIITKS